MDGGCFLLNPSLSLSLSLSGGVVGMFFSPPRFRHVTAQLSPKAAITRIQLGLFLVHPFVTTPSQPGLPAFPTLPPPKEERDRGRRLHRAHTTSAPRETLTHLLSQRHLIPLNSQTRHIHRNDPSTLPIHHGNRFPRPTLPHRPQNPARFRCCLLTVPQCPP